MSRSRVLLALLAMSFLASACAVVPPHNEIVGCKDLSVGEQTDLRVTGYSPVGVWERSSASWSFLEGSGTLEPSEGGWEAQYTATQAGTVWVWWQGSATIKKRFVVPGVVELPNLSAKCTFEVFDATVSVEGSGYDVTAVVTVSTVEGVVQIGAESAAIWRFVFDCPDGRCDVEVLDGGPYGDLAPFMAAYQGDMENFVFDFVLDTPANSTCGDDRWVGEIIPLGWDDQGPAEFTFAMVNVLTCDTGDIVVEWEGEGTRS